MGVQEVMTHQYISLHPQVKIELVYGSSGNLTAQILNGAPYQLFLSADSICPDRLAAAGLGRAQPGYTPMACSTWLRGINWTRQQV